MNAVMMDTRIGTIMLDIMKFLILSERFSK